MGIYGKLPSHGDFLRESVTRPEALAWDTWLDDVLTAARERVSDGWDQAWEAAPPWRFAMEPGLCGTAALSGVWRTSGDRVGRAFPLVVVIEAAPDDDFLDIAESCSALAVAGVIELEDLMIALTNASPGTTAVTSIQGARWWRGAWQESPDRLETAGWPDADLFFRMLTA